MWSVWWQLRWEGVHRVPKCTAGADGAQASHMQETHRLVRAHAHGFPYSSQFVILPSAFFFPFKCIPKLQLFRRLRCEPLQTFQMHGVCFFQHRDFFYSILFCDLYKICYIILNFSQIRYSEHMLAFVSAELSFEDPQP